MPQKFRSPSQDEAWIGERLFVRELMNHPDAGAVSLARCRAPAGAVTQLHRLSVAEWYVVEAGEGMMEVGGAPAFAISQGDCVHIPAGVSQRVSNPHEADLIFQSICIPRFTPACYESLE